MTKNRTRSRRDEMMPLSEFSPEHRARIEYEVSLPHPPPRYREMGGTYRPLAIIDNRAWWEWHWARGIDPDKKRTPLPQWKRYAVIERDGLVCGICGGVVAEDDVHIDHIYPWSLGGSDELDNLQVAHSSCNIRKGARV